MPVRDPKIILIRYAGWDSSEHVKKCRKRVIDAARASELRGRGLSWKDVARELTDEAEPVPFTTDGVYAAVRRSKTNRRRNDEHQAGD